MEAAARERSEDATPLVLKMEMGVTSHGKKATCRSYE